MRNVILESLQENLSDSKIHEINWFIIYIKKITRFLITIYDTHITETSHYLGAKLFDFVFDNNLCSRTIDTYFIH